MVNIMKINFFLWSTLFIVGIFFMNVASAQVTVQAGIFSTAANTLEIKAKPNAAITNIDFTNIVITIRWEASLGLNLGTVTSPTYHLIKVGSESSVGAYVYQRFASTPDVKITWDANSENSLFSVDVVGGTSTAIFEIVNDSYTNANNGDWYFEIFPGGDRTNNATPFYQSSVEALVPVELISFTGTVQGRTIALVWKTATEVNSSSYEIERRMSGGSWKKIGEQKAAGVSNKTLVYRYQDNLTNIGKGNVVYRIKALDHDGSYKYSAEVEVAAVPTRYSLEHNYPNPFNPTTKIQYSLPEDAKVRLAVYDILGRQVAELVNEEQRAGYYEKAFTGNSFSSGIYFYRIMVEAQGKNAFTQVKKMLLMK
jgi:hypothetical protein